MKYDRQEFYDCIADIICHPAVLQMKKYPHHCDTNCYRHCMNVAFYNYKICKKLSLNARSAARAGILHDLFLYDWRKHAGKTGDHFHGLTHPDRALKNAAKYFELTPLEADMITKHMWPLTVILPKYRESYVISFTDKYCGACEIFAYYSGKIMPAKLFQNQKKVISASRQNPRGNLLRHGNHGRQARCLQGKV